jgi:hypothetical protein
MLQAPFYEQTTGARHWAAVLWCARATGSDVVIAWAAYALAAGYARDRWWLGVSRRRRPLTVFLAAGLLITVGLEWVNVYVRRQWAYSPDMPVILGIGLTPLLQWLLVPLLALWLARRHLSTRDEGEGCSSSHYCHGTALAHVTVALLILVPLRAIAQAA